MLTKKDFKQTINYIKSFDDFYNKVHNILGIDLLESDLFASITGVFDLIFKTHYTDIGVDIINQWIYDGKFGSTPVKCDSNVVLQSIDDLYNYCEQYKN